MAFLALLLLCGGASDTLALDMRVEVREEGESGVAAKEKAMAGAAQTLFSAFVRDSVSTRHQERALKLLTARERELVESIFIDDEVIGPGSYRARLRFVLREGALRSILAEASIPFVTEPASPTLVIPYERRGGKLAIAPEGEWYRLWQEKAGRKDAMAPIAVPRPPFEKSLFDEVTLAMGFEEQLLFLGMRFGTRAITFAVLDGEGEDLTLRLRGEDAIGAIEADIPAQGLRGAPGAGMEPAARKALILLEDRWKDAAAQPLAGMEAIRQPIRVPLLYGVEEWNGIETRLRATQGLQRMDLTHLAQTHAEADLFMMAGPQQIMSELEKAFIVLEAEDGVLVLRPLSP